MPGNNPLVSFLIPSYNHEKYVTTCLDSVLSQTYSNFEIIIIDDCSKDATVSKIIDYKDSRIVFSKNTFNRGMNGTLSETYKKAQGKYIVLLASDDYVESDYLEKMVYYFETKKDCTVLYPGIQPIDDQGKKLDSTNTEKCIKDRFEILRYLFLRGNILASPGMMIKKEYSDTFFPLSAGIEQHQDFIMHIQLLLQGNCAFLDDLVMNYRVPNDSNDHISSDNVKAFKRIEIETPYALNYFLRKIDSVEMLKNIFGTMLDAYGKSTDKTIPYFLSRIAIDTSDNRLLQLWGFRTLISFLSENNNQELLFQLYGFDFASFSKLTAKVHTLDYYLEEQAKAFTETTCWKITKPIRLIKDLFVK